MKISNQYLILTGVSLLGSFPTASVLAKSKSAQPNVIFFALDDLNDWINPLGYSQAKSPNFDRLAKAGLTFNNAHTCGTFSAPSRAALMTGLHASKTGVYGEDFFMYDHPDYVTLQMASLVSH